MARNKSTPEKVIEGSREGKTTIEYVEKNYFRNFMYLMIGLFFIALIVSIIVLNYFGMSLIDKLIESIDNLTNSLPSGDEYGG